jgi:hypothetical protein
LKPGILRDLEVDRTRLAEGIAAEVPTLSIAGDFVLKTDGTVPVECTKVPGARSIVLPGVPHAALRRNPAVIDSIKSFWNSLRK